MLDVTTCSPRDTRPKIPRLSASVPPLVKIISAGRAFSNAATLARALSTGARAYQPVVVELFDHVRGPAADAGDCKNRREQVNVYAQGGVCGSGVEINVGVEMFFVLDVLLDLRGHVVPLGIRGAAEIARHLAQVRSARILGVVDAVSEA